MARVIGLHGAHFARPKKHGLASIVFGLTVMFAVVLSQSALYMVIMT